MPLSLSPCISGHVSGSPFFSPSTTTANYSPTIHNPPSSVHHHHYPRDSFLWGTTRFTNHVPCPVALSPNVPSIQAPGFLTIATSGCVLYVRVLRLRARLRARLHLHCHPSFPFLQITFCFLFPSHRCPVPTTLFCPSSQFFFCSCILQVILTRLSSQRRSIRWRPIPSERIPTSSLSSSSPTLLFQQTTNWLHEENTSSSTLSFNKSTRNQPTTRFTLQRLRAYIPPFPLL